ncbi:MAG: diguanylate cyclase [Clostridia bacterium]|nr:diguanylate cyclase [Clostridia bacterium]
MKKETALKKATDIMYAALCVLFIAFAVYMLAFENIRVFSARETAPVQKVENYTKTELEDSSAPMGVRREYSWTLENTDTNEACLVFYLVHSYADVRFDGELVYSLAPDENNRIGSSPSSNWVVIPVYPSDEGRQVTVTVTPVYKSVLNREIEFKVGPEYSVFMQQLNADLPQLLLTVLCVILGLVFIAVQLYFIFTKNTSSRDLFYLGNFSLLIGIWRITDVRYSSVIFREHTMALGYITIAVLFIVAVPMLMFIDDHHMGSGSVALRISAIITCLAAFGVLVCQIFGVADLREMLTVCHVMLIIDILVLVVTVCMTLRNGKGDHHTMLFIILLVVGAVSDLVFFYIRGTSSGMMVTLCALIIYAVYYLSDTILNINKKAYIDQKTKLYNKARWDEFVEEAVLEKESVGIMMLDLNSLKHTNDTLGHKTGDRIITEFAGILQKTMGADEFLCRWGGDEFTVLVRNATREKMEYYDAALHAAVDEYNKSDDGPSIYFASGYALSDDFPGLSKQELLVKADERMYKNKQQWYEKIYNT